MGDLLQGASRKDIPRRTWLGTLKPDQLKECLEAKRKTVSNSLNASQVARNIVEKFKVCVSYRTVQRWLTDGKD